jgi:hypothetical protein
MADCIGTMADCIDAITDCIGTMADCIDAICGCEDKKSVYKQRSLSFFILKPFFSGHDIFRPSGKQRYEKPDLIDIGPYSELIATL